MNQEVSQAIVHVIESAAQPLDTLLGLCESILGGDDSKTANVQAEVQLLFAQAPSTLAGRFRLFKQCHEVCSSRGGSQSALMFHGLYLWLILESTETLLTATGRKWGHGGYYDISARARAGFLAGDLGEAADALEALAKLLEGLSAETLLRRVRRDLLRLLVVYATYLVEVSNWHEAALVRARYLRVYRLVKVEDSPDGPGEHGSPSLGKEMGETVARMHFTAKMTHGTLLKENFFSGGGVTCLGRGEQHADFVVDAFAEDLISLRFQCNPEEWHSFCESYASTASECGGSAEQATQVLDRLSQVAPDSIVGKEADTLPFRTMHMPHWIIRVIRFALRHSAHKSVDLRSLLDQAQQIQGIADRIERLELLSLAAEGIDPNLQSECLSRLVSTLHNCLLTNGAELVEAEAERALQLFGELPGQRLLVLLAAQAEHARALQNEESKKKIACFRSASYLYIQTGNPSLYTVSLHCLQEARSLAAPQETAQIIADTMRICITIARESRDGRYILAALDVKQQARELTDENRFELEAMDAYARVHLEPDAAKRVELLRRALTSAKQVPHLSEFVVELQELLHQEGVETLAEAHVADSPRQGSMAMLLAANTGDWDYAVSQMKQELANVTGENDESQTLRALLAAQLAMAYEELADREPQRHTEAIDAVTQLANGYMSFIPRIADEQARASAAGTLGWAMVRMLHGEEHIRQGVELLELAVSLCSSERGTSYFINLSNLANGYRALSRYLEGDKAVQLLRKAAETFQQVVVADAQYTESQDLAEKQLGESLGLDYYNLGLVYQSLANATYDATFIHQKALESAGYLRNGIEAFSKASELAQRSFPAIAASATKSVGDCFIDVCRHYYQEKHWAAGDLERAMYDWLCEVAGGRHISTLRWLGLCAESALDAAMAAALYGINHHASVMIESIDTILDLWGLSRRADSIPEHVRLHAVLAVVDLRDLLVDSGRAEAFVEQFKGLKEVAALAEATSWVDIFRELHNQQEAMSLGVEALEECAQGQHPLVRGIATTMLRWYRIDPDPFGIGINGLYIRPDRDDVLEIQATDLRRVVRLSGLSLFSSEIAMVRGAYMLDRIGRAVAHIEPLLDWDDVPEIVPTGKLTALGADTEFNIETVRVPMKTWDVWLVTITPRRPGRLLVEVDLPFWSKYDPVERNSTSQLPLQTQSDLEVVSFGRKGLSIDVLPTAESSIRVDGTYEKPIVEIRNGGCQILLKATPMVVNCEAAILIKDEGPNTAVCCGISPPTTLPSRAFPDNPTNSFIPIFFFQDQIDPATISFLKQIDLRTLTIVGVPNHVGELHKLLEVLYTPLLEVSCVIEENEIEETVNEINRFGYTLLRKLGTQALFGSETVYVGDTNPLSGFQIVNAPRPWAPATVQMLLDLAQTRRVSLEHTPILVGGSLHSSGETESTGGSVAYLSTKGNPRLMRRMMTMVQGVAPFNALAALYGRAQQGMTSATYSEFAPEQLREQLERLTQGTVGKRPLYIIPDDIKTRVAVAPHVRLHRAIPLPMDERAEEFIDALQPTTIYTSVPPERLGTNPDHSNRQIVPVETSQAQVCSAIVQASNQLFSIYTSIQKESKYAHLRSQLPLLESFRPGNYAVLCTWSEQHAAWAVVLANYAATLGSPIVFVRSPEDCDIAGINRLLARLERLNSPALLDMPGAPKAVLQQSAEIAKGLSSYIGNLIADEVDILDQIAPQFLGIATPFAAWPMELAGSPPLSLRYATGRLSGPTLAATAEIVARAALSEEVNRKPWLNALLLCASSVGNEPCLASAVGEIETITRALEHISFVRVDAIVDNIDDVRLVQQRIQGAELFHFAGHARHSLRNTADIELLLTGGTMTSGELPDRLDGQPIVFANACSSGSVKADPGKTMQGLAATFLQKGASNYIGNLWPVLDRTAATIAYQFYPKICNGVSVGQALMEAKQSMASESPSSWGAIVLYGCPRNRIIQP